MGLAVWLVPPPEEAKLLKQLMRVPTLLESLPYLLPSFEPHITIASFPSSVPLERLRAALDDSTQSGTLRVEFTALSVGDAYFRSVLIDIVPTPELDALHERVTKALPEYEARSPRFPHLSLLYIPDEYAKDRERVREAVWSAHGVPLTETRDVPTSQAKDQIAFDLPVDDGRRRLDGFDGEEVWIVQCEGAVKEWTVLDGINLVRRPD